MNPHESEGGYCHIETVISGKKRNDPTVMYQAPSYDLNIKAWEKLGGDTLVSSTDEKSLDNYVENWDSISKQQF